MTRATFGTDGIRGKAGDFPLDGDTVRALGVAAGRVLGKRGATALVAMDPRESSTWLSASLVGGLRLAGLECWFAGVLPTPAVAWLCRTEGYSFGVVISASHNPYGDNGIKFFSREGFKLPEETERKMEEALEAVLVEGCPSWSGEEGGEVAADHANGYLAWLRSHWRGPGLAALKVVLDGANGSASDLGPRLFRSLGAEVVATACTPNGRNINSRCGSMYPQTAAERVRECKADMGFSFDGDADRCLAITSEGKVLDGDYLLFREAVRLKEKGLLNGDVVVGTAMSNLWLEQALEREGLSFVRAPVGDRNVFKTLREREGMLGGEPSGHILLLDRTTTGDGLLTALTYAMLAREAGSMDALAEGVTPYPQKILNLRVKERLPLDEQPTLRKAVEDERALLGENGRIVVRYSGTEPLLRIMVEASSEETVNGVLERLTPTFIDQLGEG